MADTTQNDFLTDRVQQHRARKMHMLGQMTGGFAHDINNILAVMMGAAKLMARDIEKYDAAEALQRCMPRIEAIIEAGARGSDLAQRVLRFGQTDLLNAPEQCDLVRVIEQNISLLQSILTRRITLDVVLPDQPVWVQGDADGISHILVNLAMNAREAIEHTGTVTIRILTPTQNKAILQCRDTGRGIDPMIMPHIFDPFFSTKKRAGGLGLGLSLAADIMHAYHGTIAARSATDIGTEMTLSFQRMGLMAARAQPPHERYAHLADRTILVVDDEEALLPIIVDQLGGLGCKVLHAANASRAMDVQEQYHGDIDVLLTDVVMPDLDGVRLADAIRTSRPHMGVVYMTGYARNPEIIQRIAPLPEHALVVPKPLDTRVLSDALEKALAQVESME